MEEADGRVQHTRFTAQSETGIAGLKVVAAGLNAA